MPNQMLRAGKTFLVFGAIGMLGVFVFLIALGSNTTPPPSNTSAPTASIPKTGNVTLSVLPQASVTESSSALTAEAQHIFSDEPNATQDLAKKLAAEIIQRNPTGPGPAGAQQLNLIRPNDAVNQFISDAVKNFDPAEFHPRVPVTDLNLVQDSTEAFQNYFRGRQTVLQDNFSDINFVDMNDLSKMDFVKIRSAYANAIAALLKLQVPQSLAMMHQKEVSLVKGQAKMMDSLTRYNDDPLQSYLALTEGKQLSEEFVSLNSAIADFIATHHLTI